MPHPRLVDRRARELRHELGAEIARLRVDAGLTRAALARAAGIDPGYLLRVERGDHEPSLRTLIALSEALRADLAVRFYPTTGPRIHDRHQSLISDALLTLIDGRRWTPAPEVAVHRPARGSIDLVLHDRPAALLVATEIESLLRRLEQLLRWHQDKASSLPSADLWRPAASGGRLAISRLLVIRSTATNRELAGRYEHLLGAAYPAKAVAARAALVGDGPWPGPSILWADVRSGRATILEGAPRRVGLGR